MSTRLRVTATRARKWAVASMLGAGLLLAEACDQRVCACLPGSPIDGRWVATLPGRDSLDLQISHESATTLVFVGVGWAIHRDTGARRELSLAGTFDTATNRLAGFTLHGWRSEPAHFIADTENALPGRLDGELVIGEERVDVVFRRP